MAAGEAPALSLPTSTPPLTRKAAEEYAPVAMLLLPRDEAEQQRMRRIHMAWATIDAGQSRRTDALDDALPASSRRSTRLALGRVLDAELDSSTSPEFGKGLPTAGRRGFLPRQ